jgi:hypothetical protein
VLTWIQGLGFAGQLHPALPGLLTPRQGVGGLTPSAGQSNKCSHSAAPGLWNLKHLLTWADFLCRGGAVLV